MGVEQQPGETAALPRGCQRLKGLPRRSSTAVACISQCVSISRGSAGWSRCRPRPAPAAPRRSGCGSHCPVRLRCAVASRTSGEVERAALPGSLSTQIRPPISSTSRDEIVRPSPVPPYLRVVELSACANGSKMALALLGGMPMPVSRTVNCSARRPSSGWLLSARRASDHFALLGELDGVADQVDEDLAQAARVAARAVGHVGRDVDRPAPALCSCARSASVLSVSPSAVAQVEIDSARGRACRPRSWRSRGCR